MVDVLLSVGVNLLSVLNFVISIVYYFVIGIGMWYGMVMFGVYV